MSALAPVEEPQPQPPRKRSTLLTGGCRPRLPPAAAAGPLFPSSLHTVCASQRCTICQCPPPVAWLPASPWCAALPRAGRQPPRRPCFARCAPPAAPAVCPFILGNEFCERLAFYGYVCGVGGDGTGRDGGHPGGGWPCRQRLGSATQPAAACSRTRLAAAPTMHLCPPALAPTTAPSLFSDTSYLMSRIIPLQPVHRHDLSLLILALSLDFFRFPCSLSTNMIIYMTKVMGEDNGFAAIQVRQYS